MPRKRSRRRARSRVRPQPLPSGTSPGTLAVDPDAPKPIVTVMAFDAERLVEDRVERVESLAEVVRQWPVTWVNVEGLGDVELIARLGEVFKLHRLALEDVTDTRQRAKVEDYPEHLFFITRMTTLDVALETEQLSIFLGKSFVLSFQEAHGDCFGPVRERLRKPRTRIRSSGPDYLAYALLDAVIDNYFPVLERYGEEIEAIEDQVIVDPSPRIVHRVHGLKRDLMSMRRAVWPLREAVNSLIREQSPRFAPETRYYLRDCYDHVIQVLEVLEGYRDVASVLMESYLSSISNRMNEVMKVLTVISTIFIPLSFIASVYGMNFDRDVSPWNMPELGWPLGYPFALGLMLATALALLYFFRRKGWLRALRPEDELKEDAAAEQSS